MIEKLQIVISWYPKKMINAYLDQPVKKVVSYRIVITHAPHLSSNRFRLPTHLIPSPESYGFCKTPQRPQASAVTVISSKYQSSDANFEHSRQKATGKQALHPCSPGRQTDNRIKNINNPSVFKRDRARIPTPV